MQRTNETPTRITRRTALGAAMIGAGAAMGGLGFRATADTLRARGRLYLGGFAEVAPGLKEAARFPATVPAIHAQMYLQAHRLDTGFYDTHFEPGGYLETHARHDRNWG